MNFNLIGREVGVGRSVTGVMLTLDECQHPLFVVDLGVLELRSAIGVSGFLLFVLSYL